MAMADTDSSKVFSSIFGAHTQGLSIFSKNAFRRPKPCIVEELGSSARIAENQTFKERAQIRVLEAEQEDGKAFKKKKKEKLEQASSEPLSLQSGKNQRDHPPIAGKKENLGSVSERASVTNKRKLRKQVDSNRPTEKSVDSATKESKGKRALEFTFEQKKPSKRLKTSSSDRFIAPIASQEQQVGKSVEDGSEAAKTATKRKKDDSADAKHGKKRRKLEDTIEATYEKKLLDNSLAVNDNPGPASEVEEEENSKDGGICATSGKRKRIESDERTVDSRKFDAEEKLKRTIFVGNMPLMVKRKAVMKEFSVYGLVESVRLRSVPLIDTKIPRKGAIIKGQINKAVSSQHAYVVFKETACANAALAHNMKEFYGNHLRVDVAHAPRQAMKGKSTLQYDPQRSIFVGNVPFDVKDEELYQTFDTGKSPEMGIEAIRVVRDPQTSVSKGFAYVLFKTKAGALPFLSPKRKVKLRDRILRISRVLASRSTHKDRTPLKRPTNVQDVGNSQSPRKRAKLSASYQGVRASKQSRHLGREKRKSAGGRSDGQQQVNGSLSGQSPGIPLAIGAKRKRAEKHQRGISRSKKIRRT